MSTEQQAEVPVGVAVAQFAPGTDREGNLRRIEELTDTAVARGASLVVLPEYSSYFSVPVDASFRPHAETLDGPFVAGLRRIAAKTDATLAAGFVEVAGERFRNTVAAVDSTGVLAVYRKQHLYDAFGERESDHVEPGDVGTAAVFDHRGLTVGLQTCYDLRFPESTRVLADAGCDLVVVPAEWVRGPLKEHHWSTLLAARAIENTLYMAGADHVPPVGVGRSAILDPMGVEVAGLGAEEDVAVAWASKERISAVRAINPALALRRYRVVPR